MKKNILFSGLVLISVMTLTMAFISTPVDQTRSADCIKDIVAAESFTPNGDGTNDAFYIDFPCVPYAFELTIYNRWGEEVVHSTDYKFRWDGSNKDGEMLAAGTYVWKIVFSIPTIENAEKKGNVTLIR